MTPTPILLIGDAPEGHSGLSRIGHDLAWLLCSIPEFRVGYLGRNSVGRNRFPWMQYHMGNADGWGEKRLADTWQDFSQGKPGIVFSVWDATRMLWLAQDRGHLPANVKLWGYFMQDCEGITEGCIPYESAFVMTQYDRICLASKWAYARTTNTIQGHRDIDWIPHGLNLSTFKHIPEAKAVLRSSWGIPTGSPLIGCVMANQERKRWATVVEAISLIPEAWLWMRTDKELHYWNIYALLKEYGILERTVWEMRPLTDTDMAMRYSACDCTVVISGGEGFCYPLAESLACGTPVVSGQYGAQCDFKTLLEVEPSHFSVEGQHNIKWAHYNPLHVAQRIRHAVTMGPQTGAVNHLDWTKIGTVWQKWFRKGLA